MTTPPRPTPTSSLSLADVYYTLFRHKWKIGVCTMLGMAGALVVYELKPPPFQSEAKLFIRYVISENRTTGPSTPDVATKSPDRGGETIMTSELEILKSFDLARQVAELIGPQKILANAKGEKSLNRATGMIASNLSVEIPPRTSVIRVQFKHPDVDVVQPVLREIVERYLKTHVATHRSVGVLGDLLIQETDQLRSRLAQTEEELRTARNKAGVISFDDARKNYSDQIAALRQQIFNAQAQLAERTSVLEELSKRPEPGPTMARTSAVVAPEPEPAIPPDKVAEYHMAQTRVARLRKVEQELLIQYTPENIRVKEIRAQLADAESARAKLEEAFPGFVAAAVTPVEPMDTRSAAIEPRNPIEFRHDIDLRSAAVEVPALQAKIKTLNSQMEQLRGEVARLDQLEGSILELRRKKELEEANYRYYAASLEQARINETLGNGRVSNISLIQTPTPPSADWSKTYKFMAGLLAAGIGLGLAWAFAIELFLDRTIRRATEVEKLLGLPLFLNIPRIRPKRRFSARRARQLATEPGPLPDHRRTAGRNGSPRDEIGPMTAFHDTLRDRLISYFESRNLTHKPKLIAISGLEPNSGVTTIATGLSRSLSESGENSVLLVDMTAGQGSAQEFVKGKSVCGLDQMLDRRDDAQVEQKLYVVSGNDNSNQLSRNLPARFSKLVPQLRASEFDYIVFDMPLVSQISITPRLAPYMDMVLIVVEHERTNRDVLQQAATLLTTRSAPVAAVLNKTRSYVPNWLHPEF